MAIRKEPEYYDVIFRKRLVEAEGLYGNRTPFCRKCAQLEFDKIVKAFINDMEQKHGVTIGDDDLRTDAEMIEAAKKFDFAKLAGESVFKKTSEVAKRAYDSTTGKLKPIIEGYDINYVCKTYGHGCTLYMVVEEFEAYKAAKK